MANRCVLTGRLTADPELRQTPSNVSVTSFRIAVPRKYKKDATDFIDIVAWRKEAEFVCQYFTKGKWIEVDGSIQTRTYTDREGKNRTAVEIVADSVSFVGDKPKEDGAPAYGNAAPPPQPQQPAAPTGFDPFAGAASAAPPPPPDGFPTGYAPPVYASGGAGDFADIDDDGDLPF